MRARLWRFVEWRLNRTVPAHRVREILAELAEDYAAQERRSGALHAAWWLLRESRSLALAYRTRDLQTWAASTSQDATFALRSARRRPARFLAAAGMLGLAIGLTTTMFTIVDALVLRPVPFEDPEQLATVLVGGARGGPPPTQPVFRAWRGAQLFAGVEGVTSDVGPIDTDSGDARRSFARVTPGVFALLGNVRPIAGRLFVDGEGKVGAEGRAVVSEQFWKSAFHSDPTLIGRTIRVGKTPAVVVGILPESFHFPSWETTVWVADTFDAPDMFAPVTYVRFADGVPRAEVLRRATDVGRNVDPKGVGDRWAQATSLSERQVDTQYKQAAPMLALGVMLLFVVLCANVSSLQLAGITARAREFATRAAIGASRSRLVRQALIENAIVGVAGVAVGIGLASLLLSVADVWLLDALSLHSLRAANLDRRALIVTSLAGLAATLGAGLLPAVLGTRVQGQSLRLTDRSGTESARARSGARVLLVCQVALSCALLVGAALLARSFVNLVTADRGFDSRNVLVARMQMPRTMPVDKAWPDLTARALHDEALAIPGITTAAWSYGTPPAGAATQPGAWTSDAPGARPISMELYQFVVGQDFFGLYGIPIVRGRALEPSDPRGTVLVGERLANMLWPGLDPIGRTFTRRPSEPAATVVGVVKEIRWPSLNRELDAPQFYMRFEGLRTQATLSMKCAGSCPDTEVVRQRLAKVVPDVDVYSVKTLESSYAREFARPRAAAGLAMAFAFTALAAAATGLFSLLSQIVVRRRREFGIRAALGASVADLGRVVMRDSTAIAVIGMAIGATGGVIVARAMRSFLYGVGAADPVIWISVIGLLAVAVAAASWLPTRAAIRTSPVILLRDE